VGNESEYLRGYEAMKRKREAVERGRGTREEEEC
jgi:hypothetical protein